MKKVKVVSSKYLPARLPVGSTAVAWLLLDRFHVQGPALGAAWALVGLVWVIAIFAVCTSEPVAPSQVDPR